MKIEKLKLAKTLEVDRDIILGLFRGRCVRCMREAVTVHEIYFRSEGKISLSQEYRVPLCASCHEWAHSNNKKNVQKELILLRKEALTKYENN